MALLQQRRFEGGSKQDRGQSSLMDHGSIINSDIFTAAAASCHKGYNRKMWPKFLYLTRGRVRLCETQLHHAAADGSRDFAIEKCTEALIHTHTWLFSSLLFNDEAIKNPVVLMVSQHGLPRPAGQAGLEKTFNALIKCPPLLLGGT